MGWQPVAAVLLVRRYVEPGLPLDAGLRRARARFMLLAVLVPCLAMLAASVVELALAPHGAVFAASLPAATFWSSFLVVMLMLSAGALVYGQCLVEEVAWRGYFLVRAMELAGPRRGLIAHGLIWGIWYAPIVMLTAGGASGSLAKAAEFVVTCVLLGISLGWLRLASRSIVPAVTANVTLTLGAGLPIMLSGSEVGSRAAVYLPAGWAPLLLISCWLVFTRHRSAIAIPRPPRKVRAFHAALQ
jgi:membrane protease YdiL (CAAX protease family)